MQNYSFVQQIGEGSFGKVYLAKSKKCGKMFAVKELKRECRSFDEAKHMREVQAHRNIPGGHPNMIQAHEVHLDKCKVFLVLEHMNAGTLYDMIVERQESSNQLLLPEDEIQDLTRQMLSGLNHCHKHKFFHRDLKPDNFLLHQDEASKKLICKLADFGLSLRTPQLGNIPPIDAHLTSYISTRWYRAPEILLCDKTYSSPVDVFALGCIFSELYELSPLFPGESEVDQLHVVLSFLGYPTASTWSEGYQLLQKLKFRVPNGRRSSSCHRETLEEILEAHRESNAALTDVTNNRSAGSATCHKLAVARKSDPSTNNGKQIVLKRLSGRMPEEQVSKHAFPLIHGLLALNPSKRFTTQQALQHAYFQDKSEREMMVKTKLLKGRTISREESPTSVTAVAKLSNPFNSPYVAKPLLEKLKEDGMEIFM